MNQPAFSEVDVSVIGLIMKYGKLRFTLSESAEIVGHNKDGFAAYLHERGVTVERRGTRKGSPKYVHVADLARIAADKSNNVAAIRKD